MSMRQVAVRRILNGSISNWHHYRPISLQIPSVQHATTIPHSKSLPHHSKHHFSIAIRNVRESNPPSPTTTSTSPTDATETIEMGVEPTTESILSDEGPKPRNFSLAKKMERKQKVIDKKKANLQEKLEAAALAKEELRKVESEYRILLRMDREKKNQIAKAKAAKLAVKAKKEKEKQKRLDKKRAKMEVIKKKREEKKQAIREREMAKKEAAEQRELRKIEREKAELEHKKDKQIAIQLLKEFPDPNAPKRPSMPWPLFYQQYLIDTTVVMNFSNAKELIQDASNKWRSMPEEEKAPYYDKSNEQRSTYKVLKSIYDGTNSREQWIPIAKELKASKPAKNCNGYSLYSKEIFPLHYQPPNEDDPKPAQHYARKAFKEVGKAWKQLSDEEKARYNELAKQEVRAWRNKVASHYGGVFPGEKDK